MSRAVKLALETIEALDPKDRQELIAEVLRRVVMVDHELPNDEALVTLADEVFLDLDRREDH